MVLYGDNIDKRPMFSGQLANNRKMAELAKAAPRQYRDRQPSGPRHQGNSHFPMMEKNNCL
jgi:hypothetical protein